MPRYYFHLCDGKDILLDDEGRELEADQLEAMTLSEARAMIAADVLTGEIFLNQSIEVHDETGRIVHRLSFDKAVDVRHDGVRPR
jgi:hypothetical protein